MAECTSLHSMLITGGRVLVITALLIITSESRPQKYPGFLPPQTYYDIAPEKRPLNRPTRNGYSAGQIKAQSEESKIIFPEQREIYTPEVSGNSQRPKCAKEEGYCESADDYPQAYVRNIFQNEANSYSFGSDYVDINLRINPDKDMSLCPSMEQVVYPKIAQNKDEKWLFVINQENYLQGIRIEKCARQGSCTFADSFPSGYETSCQQKFIYRKLLALGEDGRPVTDSFRLPSCCSCVVTKLF